MIQQDIAKKLEKGIPVKDIARQLGVSRHTVYYHKRQIENNNYKTLISLLVRNGISEMEAIKKIVGGLN